MSVHNLFIVLALIFFANSSFSQRLHPVKQRKFVLQTDSLSFRANTSFTLRKDAYIKNLAFFCKQEWKLEKTLKVPIRLRIGSLEQCNRLEGKNN
jgi:hypothetical protein